MHQGVVNCHYAKVVEQWITSLSKWHREAAASPTGAAKWAASSQRAYSSTSSSRRTQIDPPLLNQLVPSADGASPHSHPYAAQTSTVPISWLIDIVNNNCLLEHRVAFGAMRNLSKRRFHFVFLFLFYYWLLLIFNCYRLLLASLSLFSNHTWQ